MTSLGQSAFLQALGWAIADSLWQVALLWAIYQLAFLVLRRANASVKSATSTFLLFVGFAWFIGTLANQYQTIRTAGSAIAAASGSASGPGQTWVAYLDHWLAVSAPLLPYLSSAYLLVLAFCLLRIVNAYRQVHEVRHQGLRKMEARWRVYVGQWALHLGLRRPVSVWLSERVDVPATIGYLKPVILLPIASFNHLTTEQVEAILLHELAHVKRHDYLLNLVITVVETVLFFNPFAQLLSRHIQTERENSCDDFVLHFRYSPQAYASALLSLEKQRRAVPELAMAANKTALLDRIRRILNVPSGRMNYGQKLTALLITAGILVCLAWLTPAPGNPAGPRAGLAPGNTTPVDATLTGAFTIHWITMDDQAPGKAQVYQASVAVRNTTHSSRSSKSRTTCHARQHTPDYQESAPSNWIKSVQFIPASLSFPDYQSPIDGYSTSAIADYPAAQRLQYQAGLVKIQLAINELRRAQSAQDQAALQRMCQGVTKDQVFSLLNLQAFQQLNWKEINRDVVLTLDSAAFSRFARAPRKALVSRRPLDRSAGWAESQETPAVYSYSYQLPEYREKVTFDRGHQVNESSCRIIVGQANPTGKSSSVEVLLIKLTKDGLINGKKAFNLQRKGNILIINGQKLPQSTSQRYAGYLGGKDLEIQGGQQTLEITFE